MNAEAAIARRLHYYCGKRPVYLSG